MGDINLKSVFGNNNRSQIRNKIQCNKIIQNSLKQLVEEYFSGTTIDEKFIQGVHDDTKEFEVFFGRAKAFTSPKSEYTNFQESITKFYQEIFEDAGIPERINIICTLDDVYTIAITSRDKSTPGNRNTTLFYNCKRHVFDTTKIRFSVINWSIEQATQSINLFQEFWVWYIFTCHH